ncbi:hypothetical protein SBA5_640010 [Candidatus Sulfotelmatomonas gaucii]|uniref:Uncharacterized protein n=1 Tax=Candidatus Sulfuritelmatomonas gaucii TaxID=2043161 RepID=A0A2N9LYA9_9BACT|nr:hypothetical protein SBA5_640010 [Candidatus Sulfotelmatomonas gaucii]
MFMLPEGGNCGYARLCGPGGPDDSRSGDRRYKQFGRSAGLRDAFHTTRPRRTAIGTTFRVSGRAAMSPVVPFPLGNPVKIGLIYPRA